MVPGQVHNLKAMRGTVDGHTDVWNKEVAILLVGVMNATMLME